MVTEMMRSTQNSEIREVKVTEMHDIGSGVKSVTTQRVGTGIGIMIADSAGVYEALYDGGADPGETLGTER